MLVLAVSEYFDKLFENRCLTSTAALRKLGGVMVMTVDFALVFIVTVLGAKDCRTDGTGEMLYMILPI